MTGPEHYKEAERLLSWGRSAYLDNSNDAGPRESYANDAEWTHALEFANEMHLVAIKEASLLAAEAQAHATLALAAATALTGELAYQREPEIRAWTKVAGTPWSAS